MENITNALFVNATFEIILVVVFGLLSFSIFYSLWRFVAAKFPRIKPNSLKARWAIFKSRFSGRKWNKNLNRKDFKRGRWLLRRTRYVLARFMHKLVAVVAFIFGTIYTILFPRKLTLILLVAFTFIFTALSGYHYFGIRPYVVAQSPNVGEAWQRMTHPLYIAFDKPLKKTDFTMNFAPDLNGRIEFIPVFEFLPQLELYREIKFYPGTTLAPEQELIVYLVGVENISGAGGRHEQNLDFKTGAIPEVKSVNIADDALEVSTVTEIEFELTAEDSEFLDWKIGAEPEVTATLERYQGNKLKVVMDGALKQTTPYRFVLERAVVNRNLQDGTLISSEEEVEYKLAKQLKFTTIKAPLIKEVTPQGSGVFPDSKLVIQFDLPMNTDDVAGKFKIEPEVTGTISWNDAGDILTFTPEEPLAKDTTYKMMVEKGAQSVNSGILEQPINNEFKTVGPIKILSISPGNGAGGVDPSSWISVEFDQPVDHQSAQNNFHVSPGVVGKFIWDGNKMHFQTTQSMAYGTKYTVRVLGGIVAVYGIDFPAEATYTFTTRPEQIRLAVPYYKQQESYTCNIATIRMALAYRGINLSEAQIKSGIGVGQPLSGSTGGDPYSSWINGHGTYWTAASPFISRYRNNSVMRNWNVTALLNEVAKGNPVIVWWQNGWGDWYWKSWTRTPGGGTVQGLNGMHSEVVIGYKGSSSNPTSIITHDPWRGTRTYTKAAFDSLWSRSFGRTAIIVR